jgi:hypothetical protein
MMNAVSRSSDTAALQGTAMLLSFATKSASLTSVPDGVVPIGHPWPSVTNGAVPSAAVRRAEGLPFSNSMILICGNLKNESSCVKPVTVKTLAMSQL